MLLPIGDDNRDRHSTPIVTYLLIALNVFVFVFWQEMGRDIGFTFAYSTVPAEILSGEDIITDAEIARDPITGEPVKYRALGPLPFLFI